MAKIRAAKMGGSSGGMTIESYNIGDNVSRSCTMKTGVYLTYRTDTAGYASYVKGYIENGSLTEIFRNANFTVNYDTTTHQLTISKPNTTALGSNKIYFFIVE